jgi:hypothetical protein
VLGVVVDGLGLYYIHYIFFACDNLNSISTPGTTDSSTNKTDSHDIAEISLKVVLKHHKPKQNQTFAVR